jgi:hypothetical protein
MRILFSVYSVIVGVMGSFTGPDFGTMTTFVRCECVEDLNSVRTHLYPLFEYGRSTQALYEWFKLDEESFIRLAMKPAKEAHRLATENPDLARAFRANVEPLERRGLTPDRVLTELLKSYYKSLRRKTVLQQMAEDDDEEDD